MRNIAMLILLASIMLFAQGGTPDTSGVLKGSVRDSLTNAPVQNAMVVLSKYLLNAEVIDTVVTGADGAFIFDSLLTGRRNAYTLTVAADSYALATQSNITLTTGQTDTINFLLVKGDSAVTPTGAFGAFTGSIKDSATNTALSGALVLLSVREGMAWKTLDSAITTAGGIFRFDSIAASASLRYALSVSVSGYVPKSQNNLYADSGVTDTVNFLLTPLTASNSWILYGTITADSLTGLPLSGVAVEVIQKSGTEYRYTAVTNAQGRYSVAILDVERTYQIIASLSGYLTDDTTRLVSQDSTRINLVLKTDTAGTARELSRAHTLSAGSVLSVGPNPAKGSLFVSWTVPGRGQMQVALFSPDGRLVRVLRSGKTMSGHLSMRCSLDGLPAGRYLLCAAQDNQKFVKSVVLQK